MVDLVDFCVEWGCNIVTEEFEAGMKSPTFEVVLLACEKRIDNHNFMSIFHKSVDEMRPNEASASGDEDSFVGVRSIRGIKASPLGRTNHEFGIKIAS